VGQFVTFYADKEINIATTEGVTEGREEYENTFSKSFWPPILEKNDHARPPI
jgi:hypothetical protein